MYTSSSSVCSYAAVGGVAVPPICCCRFVAMVGECASTHARVPVSSSPRAAEPVVAVTSSVSSAHCASTTLPRCARAVAWISEAVLLASAKSKRARVSCCSSFITS